MRLYKKRGILPRYGLLGEPLGYLKFTFLETPVWGRSAYLLRLIENYEKFILALTSRLTSEQIFDEESRTREKV